MLLAWMLMAICPQIDGPRHRVDLIELNHVYNDWAEPVLDQLIFWDWCPKAGRFQVRDWRLLRCAHLPPQRLWPGSHWQTMLVEERCVRTIYARAFRETWTQYDVEMDERQILPEMARRRLR